MSDMVNHPSHYVGGEGRPECIELIGHIVFGHQDIAAFCIGQVKYLYRAGKKSDSDMSIYQKALEDVKKFKWYINHIKSEHMKKDLKCQELSICHDDEKFIRSHKMPEDLRKLIANEFSIGKEESIKDHIYTVVYLLTDITSIKDYDTILEELNLIITEMELKCGEKE